MKITPHFIRLSGLLLMTFAALVIATAFFLPYLLDVNAYRDEIITALQQSLNRPVSFSSGSFTWHFGPSFRFKSFRVKESNTDADFITAKQITVQLAFLPLLEKKVELKNLILDGATISLFRNSDGTYNINDLLKSDPDNGIRVKFKEIRVNNGSIHWRDLLDRRVPFTAVMNNISLIANQLGRGEKGRLKFAANVIAESGAPTQLNLSGSIQLPGKDKSLIETALDCDLAVKQGEIGRFWSYLGKFVPFANCGGRLDLATSFKGKPHDFAAKGKIQVSGATVNWPTIFHTPLSPKKLQLEYTLLLNKGMIDISSADLSMEGFRIKGSFQLKDYLTKDPFIITKVKTPSTFRYEDVRDYVPYGIIESDTADYIENKIKTGIFKLETGVLEGRISQIAHMEIGENSNTLLIRGSVENAVLSYGSKNPTFNNLKGIIELKGKNFNLVGMSGNFGTSPFSLNGSITEYNTDKVGNYPVKMNLAPHPAEIAWLSKIAGIPKLEYSRSSSLLLIGNGHYSAYKLEGDWNLKEAAYKLPGYVSKLQSSQNTLKFSAIIGKESTKVASINYNLQPIMVSGSGLIGYGEKPYLSFDLQTNRFAINETSPILSMWQQYKMRGTVQAHIKGDGDPVDMSAMDYHGAVNLYGFSMLPDDQLKELKGINGTLLFKGNSLETKDIPASYGKSTIMLKVAIKSLKRPEGNIKLHSPRFYIRDINPTVDKADASVTHLYADFTLRNASIAINTASGLLNSSSLNMSGIYHTGNARGANLSVSSSKLDINDLRILSSTEQKSDTPQSNPLDIKLALNVASGNFGKLTFNKLHATAEQQKGTIYLQNLTAEVPGGKLSAKGRIAPGGVQGDRYDLTFDISGIDAEKLFAALDISHEVTGSLAMHGNVTARGNTLIELKKSALGNIRLNMSNGKIRKFNTLSKVFSILNVSQLLKFRLPDMASGGMPYNSVKGSIGLKDGILSTQDLFINSNAINISIIGSADIVREELNLTLGAQPLQTVDKIVNRIPIIGWLLTGKDKDLLTAYFEAKGKWSDPQVTAIPVKSLGNGVLNIFMRIFQLPVKLFTDTGEVILGK